MRFDQFVVEWFSTYVQMRNKPSEIRGKRLVITNHLVPFFGSLLLRDITTARIDAFQREQLARGLAAKTINNQVTILGRALRSATEWGHLAGLPRLRFLPIRPAPVDFLTDDECHGLLADRTEPFWRTMILVALRTGLRQGELLGLEWRDVDLGRRSLVVARSIVYGIVSSPKSNRIRQVPLTSDLVGALQSLPRVGPYVFASDAVSPTTTYAARHALQRVERRTGTRHLNWHLFRHTFASQLVQRGVPLRCVQQLLGHATITMTERYSHVATSDLLGAISVLEPEAPMTNFGQPVGNTQLETEKTPSRGVATWRHSLANPTQKAVGMPTTF
jgi:integrase